MSPSLEAGSVLSYYRVLSMLGSGGMGEVYLAEDTRLERRVALKVLHAENARDGDRLRRFEQEARVASSLNHPNILTVHEIGHVGDVRFLATEVVDGETLRDRVARGPLPLQDAVEIALQVGSALDAAHRAGIIHRDIKPENVMIRPDGIVKVLDFGLAKLIEAAPVDPSADADLRTVTRAGMVLGTVAYMSPEQARGAELDTRSDLFSLGVVLYEMLTGRQPFTGETVSHVIVAILEQEPAPPSHPGRDTPAEIDRILRRTMEKEPDARYPTAKELQIDLDRLKRDLDSPADPAAPTPVAPPPVAPARGGHTIAVLPFANLSAAPDNEYFCDGLAEEMLNALTKIDGLTVAARTSAFSFKGKNVNTSQIGRALGVELLLQGSVRTSGKRMRIAVQLVNAANGYQVWSERYDRELRDIFDVQDEITLAVVGALELKLLAAERAAALERGTANAEAYRLYLKGRFCWNKRTAGSLSQAVELYEQAIEQEPDYALAHAGLAESYVLYSWLGVSPPRQHMPRARAAALRALAIDPSLAEAHAALGVYESFFAWDQSAGERELRRAIELDPKYATAHHWLGNIPLLAMGRFDESIAAIRRAAELEPLSPIIGSDLGVTLLYARRYGEAVAQFRETLALDPRFYVARYHLGETLHAQGDYDAAIVEYEGALQHEDDPWVTALLARSLAATDRREEAAKLRDRLESEAPRRYVPNVALAVAHGALGGRDAAFDWFEKDVAERSLYPPFYAVDPVFDDVRHEGRFAELVRRIDGAELE